MSKEGESSREESQVRAFFISMLCIMTIVSTNCDLGMDIVTRAILVFALAVSSFAAQGFELRFGVGTKSEVPSWVANPSEDDAKYIYGIGSGDSLGKAEQSALNNITGKLATVVSSNVSANTTVHQGNVNSSFSEDIKTKTFDTKLSGYEVVKSSSQDGVFYAKVRMSRASFVKDTLTRFKTIDDRLKNKVALAGKVSRLQQYFALLEIKPGILDASALVYLLQAASPSFDSESYLSVYRKYQVMAEELLYQIRFKVSSSEEMEPVAEMVIGLLGEQRLSASRDDSQPDANIAIKGAAQKSMLFGDYMTQLRIIIQVHDNSGRKINAQEYVVAGSSRTSYSNAMITATKLLQQKLEEDGILVAVGMQKPQ